MSGMNVLSLRLTLWSLHWLGTCAFQVVLLWKLEPIFQRPLSEVPFVRVSAEWAVAETSHLWRLSFCSFPCYSPAFECVRVCICAFELRVCVCVLSGFWRRAKFALSLANEACPIPTRAGNWLENQIRPCGGARFGSFPLGPARQIVCGLSLLLASRNLRGCASSVRGLDFICIEIDSGHRNPLRQTGRKLALFETSKYRPVFLS